MRRDRRRGCSSSGGLEKLMVRLSKLLPGAVMQRWTVIRGRRRWRLWRRMMDVMRIVLRVMLLLLLSGNITSNCMRDPYSTCWGETRRIVNYGSWSDSTR